jgi:C1A family cysteine protease
MILMVKNEVITKEPAPPVGELIGMGRLLAKDKRDLDHLVSKPIAKRTYRNWMSPGPVLDQGGTSECVAYSGLQFLTSHRVVNKHPTTPNKLYKACQRLDEWPGENYDGTSVRALMKWFKLNNFITEYKWAFDLDTVINHVLEVGPVVMGTTWTWDMMNTDKHGYVQATDENAGGHAWLLPCVNKNRSNPDRTTGAGRILNSWGPGWGEKGRAWITFNDLGRLIEDDGEAAIAVELKKAA